MKDFRVLESELDELGETGRGIERGTHLISNAEGSHDSVDVGQIANQTELKSQETDSPFLPGETKGKPSEYSSKLQPMLPMKSLAQTKSSDLTSNIVMTRLTRRDD